MASWNPSRRLLAAGLGLSLAVHFGVGFVARLTPVAGGAPPAPRSEPVEMAFITLPEEPPERPEPRRVSLGLERSKADTEAWLGFEDATEHEAPESEVEQSALTPRLPGGRAGAEASESVAIDAPAAPDAPAQDAEAPSEPSATDAADDAPHAAPPEPVAVPLLAGARPTPPSRVENDPLLAHAAAPDAVEPVALLDILVPPEVSPPPPSAEAADAPALGVERVPAEEPPEAPRSEPAEGPRFRPDEARVPEPRAENTPANPSPSGANTAPGEGGTLPGEKSPSESTAASLRAPIDVRPGRVAAAQGLQITTVRPVFDLATLALARPRSPTLVIEFGKDGTVRRARYLPGRATGEPSVDQPLLDAVYRWTAKGEALDQLTDDDDQTVSITMRIILR